MYLFEGVHVPVCGDSFLCCTKKLQRKGHLPSPVQMQGLLMIAVEALQRVAHMPPAAFQMPPPGGFHPSDIHQAQQESYERYVRSIV